MQGKIKIPDYFVEYAVEIDDAKERGGRIKGIRSGIYDLDSLLNGWQKGKIYVVGALKKTGKSRFVLNVASSFLDASHPGIMFSMEMGRFQVLDCLIGNREQIVTNAIRSGGMTPEQTERAKNQCTRISLQQFTIDKKSACTVDYIRSQIREVKNQSVVDFVIVDYIQRMKGANRESRVREVEGCAISLADIARDEDVIMIVISQMSGEAEKLRSSVPAYSLFKDSQAIVESADVAIALMDPNRGKANMGENFKEIDAIVLQRDGPSDMFVKLKAELQYSKFSIPERQGVV